MTIEWSGTYAEYCIADPYTAVVIPDHVTFEEAATIGLSGFTAAQALFQVGPGAKPSKPSLTNQPVSDGDCFLRMAVQNVLT